MELDRDMPLRRRLSKTAYNVSSEFANQVDDILGGLLAAGTLKDAIKVEYHPGPKCKVFVNGCIAYKVSVKMRDGECLWFELICSVPYNMPAMPWEKSKS